MGYDTENTDNWLINWFNWLSKNQQQLPPDFQKVLHDNLWELYER
jgi:hypothetical protein